MTLNLTHLLEQVEKEKESLNQPHGFSNSAEESFVMIDDMELSQSASVLGLSEPAPDNTPDIDSLKVFCESKLGSDWFNWIF
jgi:hypothetical protein